MTRVLVRRFGGLMMVLLSVSTAAFVVLRLTGDPVQMMLPPEQTTAEQVARLRHQLGLDQPVWVQYAQFLRNLATGDLGASYRYGTPVAPLILQRVPATLELAGAAVAFAGLVGVPLGVVSAVRKDGTAGVLARADAHPVLRGPPPLAAHLRHRRLAAARPARDHPGYVSAGAVRQAGAFGNARRARRGLRPDGAEQGPQRARGHRPARAAEGVAERCDPRRPERRRAAGWCHHHGDDLRVARPGSSHRPGDLVP